jgi:hypothetical protein
VSATKTARKQQPRGLAPKRQGIAFAWNATTPRTELVSGRVSSVANASIVRSGPFIAADCSTGQRNVEWDNFAPLTTSGGTGAGDFTVIVLANPSSAGVISHVWAQKNDAGGSPFSQVAMLANANSSAGAASGNFSFFIFDSSSVGVTDTGGVDGRWHVWVGRRRGTAHEIWRDGQLRATTTSAALNLSQFSTRYLAIGSRGNGTTDAYGGDVAAALGYNLALPDEELRGLTPETIWRLWPRRLVPRPSTFTAVTGFTLTADSGTYSVTGQAAGLVAARRVVADQGSYAVTGQAANLIRAVRLLADQGAYSLAGQDVALRAARLIGADSGSYSITGQAANLVYAASGAYTLTADSGTYSISGQDDALTYVPLNAYVLTADAGSYSIAGQDAALRYSGAPAGGGFPGFDVRTVDGPRMWWQRKPKKISDEEAEEKLEEVAEVIAAKAEEHAKAKKPKKARVADVVEEIRPILAEMPGFDWRPMYEAAYQAALDDELDRALRAQDVQQMAARELERIQRIQDDEDVLLIAAMM